jgi:hypothetical protein
MLVVTCPLCGARNQTKSYCHGHVRSNLGEPHAGRCSSGQLVDEDGAAAAH